ncbi:DEAD/DEAH box helicase [Hutsoniella sourekii]|uniref:DEAD/DEAH box helicase n=1 Tax=Hutsoniella sourekii TaxID=87650 RepID=UPI0004804964|nr:DEAD/DEAH box helicase [Hutsoniella sourekii]
MKFTELPLKNELIQAIQDLHFNELTPVQEEVIPRALAGSDLIVQSQTGSGKSHSFLIPIMQAIDPERAEVQAVITAPSRELASQLFEVARQLTTHFESNIQIVNYIGGTDKERQLDRLRSGHQPHIVIGTPGRILDLMSEHALWVQTGKIMVVDEADMTLDLGFLPIVDEIASRMPDSLQMMAFSATIPQQLSIFLNKYMDHPETVVIENREIISPYITNYLLNTKGMDRKQLVYELLMMGHPFLALVFVNTKDYANELSTYLKEKGLKIATIHGDIPSRDRNRLMRQIRNLDYQFVVATDLAARGIDIPGTSLVINTEVPQELEFFIHRVGRTGRNQVPGDAITFVTPDDDLMISKLEYKGIQFEEVRLINGELKSTDQRSRRMERKGQQNQESDPEITRMINQSKKKKVKPGYKRKLERNIKDHRKKQARSKARQKRRSQRKKG